MKKIYAFVLCCIIVLSMGLSGCNSEDPENFDRDVCVAVIGYIHDNMASLELSHFTIGTDLDGGPVTSGDRIQDFFGMVPDKDPTKNDLDISEKLIKGKKNNTWTALQNKVIKELNNSLDKLKADDTEVDTLKAFLNTGTECSHAHGADNHILVFDSGLCTSGAMSFIDNPGLKQLISQERDISEEDIKPIINELSRKKELPDYHNAATKITWYGIGMTGGKQTELSNLQKSNLKVLWEGVLTAAGAEVEFVDVIKSNNPINYDELPSVSVVLFDKAVQLSEEELGFEPGSEYFLKNTAEKRNKVLSKFVSEAKNNRILVVGTTSSGGSPEPDNEDFSLSWKRVDAVKTELTKLGVPESQIETLGLGTQSHTYDPNEYVNGKYIIDSPAAISNRSVYIMLDNSDDAKLFYKDQDNLKKLKESGIKTDR